MNRNPKSEGRNPKFIAAWCACVLAVLFVWASMRAGFVIDRSGSLGTAAYSNATAFASAGTAVTNEPSLNVGYTGNWPFILPLTALPARSIVAINQTGANSITNEPG